MPQSITRPAKVLLVDNGELIGQVKELINNNQLVKIRVKGNSMFPFLHHELDIVTLKHPTPEELTPGRIVMFDFGGRYILHRIIRKKDNLFYIRGDNNRSRIIEYAKFEDIIGVVTSIERGNKIILSDNIQWKTLSYLWMRSHNLRLYFYTGKHILRKILNTIRK